MTDASVPFCFLVAVEGILERSVEYMQERTIVSGASVGQKWVVTIDDSPDIARQWQTPPRRDHWKPRHFGGQRSRVGGIPK